MFALANSSDIATIIICQMKIQSVINQLKSILLQIVSEGHIILAQQQLSLDLNLYQIVHTTF